MGIENLSLSNGTLEGLALRSEANEKGDRLDVTVTPSVRRVKGNGVELSELAMEVGLKGLDTRSVETLSKMFEASCGFQNLTYDEGQKAQAAALKLMSRGLSVGIPKFGGKGTDGGISGDLMLELAEAKDGRPSLAAQLKSRGRLEVTGSLLTPEQSETVLAMGIAVTKNKGLAASFDYAEGLLKINERTHDAASLLETLREADEKMSQVIVGWSPTKSVKQVASKSSTVDPVTAPAEPARTVQVESAPAAAPVAPVAVAAPATPTAERSSAPNDCTTVVICVQQTLAAARDADIDQVRKIATTLDSMPKPNLGNRPIARQLNQSGIEALKRDDLPVALDKLRQALTENPRDVEVAGNLGFAMVKSGQAAEAVEVLQAAVVIDPRRTSTWTPLAEAYALAGRREDARAALWVSFQWSGNREKSLSFYQDRMARETRPKLQALYSHMVGVAQEQMASPK
jgi:tetratricopeptide (TPR) repeat protein